jgi:hypothetical protein
LEKAIAAPFVEAAERSATVSETGEGKSGMRTERITLEVTHGEPFGVSHWSWATILRIKSGESVRVVEEPKLAPHANAGGEANHAAPAASGGGDHFADASKMVEQPRGWLTQGEIAALTGCCVSSGNLNEEGKKTIRNLLARSSPPEVVLPNVYDHIGLRPVYLRADVVATLAAAGVAVKEVGRE